MDVEEGERERVKGILQNIVTKNLNRINSNGCRDLVRDSWSMYDERGARGDQNGPVGPSQTLLN